MTHNNYYSSRTNWFVLYTWVIKFSIKGTTCTFVEGNYCSAVEQDGVSCGFNQLTNWPNVNNPYIFSNNKLKFNMYGYTNYDNNMSYGFLYKL